LLIETDAPDQLLPEDRVEFPMQDADSGKPLNHPANLGAVYRFAAELLGRPIAALAEQVEANFLSLFGGVRRA
jgi:TatD DNase family protein